MRHETGLALICQRDPGRLLGLALTGLGQTTFGSSSFSGIFSRSIESTRLNGLFRRHSTAGAYYRPPIVEQAGCVSPYTVDPVV
jgi:hypothetical protein